MPFTLFRFSILLLLSTLTGSADITLPKIISNHMVLQQGVEVKLWGMADAGEKVTAEFAEQKVSTVADEKGEWLLHLKPLATSSKGKPLKLSGKNKIIIEDVLVGETWLAAGQSNMATGLKNRPKSEQDVFRAAKDNDHLRWFTNDRWILCSEQEMNSSVSSGVAFFFIHQLEKHLDRPVAYIEKAQNGSKIEPFIPKQDYPVEGAEKNASKIFNERIAQITNFSIKGAIWYQGESNHKSTDYYSSLKALITGWSREFGIPNIPFHMVQTAPFDYTRKGEPSSLMFENIWAAQYRIAEEMDNATVVPIHDTNINVKRIHPSKKQPVGERLAAQALKYQYGKDVPTAGPMVAKVTRGGEKAILSFTNIDLGLTTTDGEAPSFFELSGDGKTFFPAKATLKDNQVTLHAKEVASPKFVRMGWQDMAIPNLVDKNGWPVASFAALAVE